MFSNGSGFADGAVVRGALDFVVSRVVEVTAREFESSLLMTHQTPKAPITRTNTAAAAARGIHAVLLPLGALGGGVVHCP